MLPPEDNKDHTECLTQGHGVSKYNIFGRMFKLSKVNIFVLFNFLPNLARHGR